MNKPRFVSLSFPVVHRTDMNTIDCGFSFYVCLSYIKYGYQEKFGNGCSVKKWNCVWNYFAIEPKPQFARLIYEWCSI
jgi:hypothetical protein